MALLHAAIGKLASLTAECGAEERPQAQPSAASNFLDSPSPTSHKTGLAQRLQPRRTN